MIYFYGQGTAICALAGSLIIAGLIATTLPKQCDLVEDADDGKVGAGHGKIGHGVSHQGRYECVERSPRSFTNLFYGYGTVSER